MMVTCERPTKKNISGYLVGEFKKKSTSFKLQVLQLERKLWVKNMAQFTTQGRLKLLLIGEGVSSLLDQKDPFFHHKCRSILTHTHHRRRRLRHIGSSGRIYYSSFMSSKSKTNRCNAEARSTVGNEGAHDDDDDFDLDDDEFENDDLSCFRGLVLDISYRSPFFQYFLFVLFWFE